MVSLNGQMMPPIWRSGKVPTYLRWRPSNYKDIGILLYNFSQLDVFLTPIDLGVIRIC